MRGFAAVAATMLRRRLGPLARRDFALLFGARTISMAGSSLTRLALAFAVIAIGGTPSDLGLVLAATLLPQLVLVLVGGVWADRLPRHVVMVAANGTAAAAQATAALLVVTGTAEVWHLLVAAAVNGAASAFFNPAAAGLVPEVVPAAQLQQANAWLGISIQASRLIGLGLGGVLIAAFSPGWALMIDAASYLLAAALIGAIRLPPRIRTRRQQFLAELAAGWQEVRSRRWLWSVLAQFGLINGIVMNAFLILGPFLSDQRYDGASTWALVLAANAVGTTAGSALALRLSVERPLVVMACAALLIPAPLAALAAEMPPSAIAAAALLSGLGAAVAIVLWDTTLQREIPHDTLSRVSSYDWLVSLSLAPLGAVAVGPIAAAIGTETTMWIAAITATAATVAVLAVGGVRTLTAPDLVYAAESR